MLGSYLDLGNPVADHPLNYGLVSWWLPLPNNQGGSRLFDLKGGNHGTLTNGPTWGAGSNGFAAVQFDGVNDYVTCGTAGAIASGGITLYCRFRAASPGTNVSILGRSNKSGVDERNYELSITSANKLSFVYTLSTAYHEWVSTNTVSALGLTDGGWHGITVSHTYGSGAGIVVAVDGASVAGSWTSGTGNANPDSGSQTLAFGGSPTNNSNYVAATLSDIRIYSRALSAEVAALYDQSVRGHPDTLRRFSPRVWSFSPPAGGGGAFQPALAIGRTVVVGGAF